MTVFNLFGDTSPEADEIRARQVATLAKQMPMISAANLVNSALIALVFWELAPAVALLGWLAVVWLATAVRLRIWHANRRRSHPHSVGRRAVARAALWSLTAGSLWGAAGVLFFTPDSIGHQVFLVFVVGGMALGAISALCAVPITCAAFVVPSVLPLVLLLLSQDNLLSRVMAAMLCLYLSAMLFFARASYANFIDNVRSTRENSELINKLSRAIEGLEVEATKSNGVNERLFAEIAERKQAEERLRDSEKQLAEAQRIAHLGSYDWDVRSGEVRRSQQLYRMIGIDPKDGDKTPIAAREYIHPEDRNAFCANVKGMLKPGSGNKRYRVEYRALRTDGSVRYFLDQGEVTFDAYGQPLHLLGTVLDITELRQREAALRESEERFRRVFQQGPLGMAIVGRDFKFQTVNRRLCEITGYEEHELVGRTFLDITYPDDVDRGETQAERLFRGDIPHYQMEQRYLRKDDHAVWVNLVATLVRDHEGRPLYSLAMMEDITERKETAERARRHDAELAHVLRLSTMGEMASALAHQLNQPLAAVVNYSRGCLRRMTSERWERGAVIEAMELTCEQAERASQILRDIAHFVRKSKPQAAPANINEVVASAITLDEVELRNGKVRVGLELGDRLPRVPMDEVQIEQVVLNLVRNGVDAMRSVNGGTRELVIRTSADDEAIQVSLRDSGRGLEEECEGKIFEPFYSTKPDGMGMGLAISRTIVEAHGGRLWATRNADAGATFHFTLPTNGTIL